MRNVSRRTVAVLLLLFAITLSLFVTVSLVGEQEPQVAATQMAQLKIRGVKTAPIRVNDELLKQLTGKRQFNSEVVRKAISYRGEIPILKLKSGKRVALESIRAEAMPTPQEREKSLTISPKVLRYLPYIKASWIGRILVPLGLKRPVQLFQRLGRDLPGVDRIGSEHLDEVPGPCAIAR